MTDPADLRLGHMAAAGLTAAGLTTPQPAVEALLSVQDAYLLPSDLPDLTYGPVEHQISVVFALSSQSVDVDLREWVTFAHAHETDGLVFVDAPLQEGHYDRR